MKEIFDMYVKNAFDQESKNKSLTWKKEWYDYNFKKFFPSNLNAKLLDIGPGLGELLTTEMMWGYSHAEAIDISPSVVKFCQEKGLKCTFVEDSGKWLNAHKAQFDVITVLDVLEHIPQNDCADFLKGCKTALKEEGILVIQVPNIQAAESFLHRYNDLTHVFGYSQHTLEQLISLADFETVRFYPFEEYPGNSSDRKDLRRLRSIYWRFLKVGRTITHNLNPDILTPEIFAVLSKTKCDLPEHFIEGELEDGCLSRDDIRHFMLRAGFSGDTVEELYGISEWREAKDNVQEQLNDHQRQINDHQRQINALQDYLEEIRLQLKEEK